MSDRVRGSGADTRKYDCIAVPEINVVMKGRRTVGAQRKELRTLLLESEVWEASRNRWHLNWFLEVDISIFLSINFSR